MLKILALCEVSSLAHSRIMRLRGGLVLGALVLLASAPLGNRRGVQRAGLWCWNSRQEQLRWLLLINLQYVGSCSQLRWLYSLGPTCYGQSSCAKPNPPDPLQPQILNGKRESRLTSSPPSS